MWEGHVWIKKYQKLWNLAFLKLVINEKSVASVIPEDINQFEENIDAHKSFCFVFK